MTGVALPPAGQGSDQSPLPVLSLHQSDRLHLGYRSQSFGEVKVNPPFALQLAARGNDLRTDFLGLKSQSNTARNWWSIARSVALSFDVSRTHVATCLELATAWHDAERTSVLQRRAVEQGVKPGCFRGAAPPANPPSSVM
jgi:hypothetical protein